jgi:hypothetical protein
MSRVYVVWCHKSRMGNEKSPFRSPNSPSFQGEPGRRVSTTLRQVLTKFSEFFMCWIRVPSFPQGNFAPGSPRNDERPLGRPMASPLLSLLRRISLFQSRSLLAADRLQGNLGLLLCAVMPSLPFHLPPPTGSGSGGETGLLIQTSLGSWGGLGALRTKRSG